MTFWTARFSRGDRTFLRVTGMLLCSPAECSRHEVDQPWKRWSCWKFDRWHQKAIGVSRAQCPTSRQIGNETEWIQVPRRTSVQNFVCHSKRRLCTQSALGRVASEDWQARRWCGLRISYGRRGVPRHSVLTEDDYQVSRKAD